MSRADCQCAVPRLIEILGKAEDYVRAIQDPADAAKYAALVIRRHLPDPAYRIFLFGSRATGSARRSGAPLSGRPRRYAGRDWLEILAKHG